MDLISRTVMMGSAGAGGSPYWISELEFPDGTGEVRGVDADDAGNIYVTGLYQPPSDHKIFVIKYSPDGSIIWQKFLNPEPYGYGHSVRVDSSGNIYFVGGAGTAGVKGAIAKFLPDGTLSWQQYYNPPGATGTGYDIAVDSSGNIYYAGSHQSNRIAYGKFDSSGALLARLYDGSNSGYYAAVGAITVAADGSIYAVSKFEPSFGGYGNSDMFMIKMNSSLGVQWQRVLGTAGRDYGYGVATDSSGNVYFLGSVNGSLIAKFASDGIKQWQRTLSQSDVGDAKYLIVDSNDTVIATSVFNENTPSGSIPRGCLYARDTSGNLLWQRKLSREVSGFPHHLYFEKLCVASEDSVAIVGRSFRVNDTPSYRGLVMKLPKDGSMTGTYGDYSYAESTFVNSTPTTPDKASSMSLTNSTLVVETGTLTVEAGTLPSSLIAI